MTKLITETPEHPIPFLIDHLQAKQGSHGHIQRTLSGSAALWAESEASVPRSVGHLKCDWKSKSEHHDFDELNHILQESKKLGKALENLSQSIAISDELNKETAAFNTSLLRPRVVGEWIGREENDADPLADEMLQPPVPRSKIEQWDSEDSSSPGGSLKMKPKTKGLKHQQQQHKKLLAAMLSQDSFDSLPSTTPSVTEEDIDNEDDAMELHNMNLKIYPEILMSIPEDLDDLRMEGVTSVVSTGSKFNQTRSSHTAEPQAKVTLNICARCASQNLEHRNQLKRLQGDTLIENAEDPSVVSHTFEQEGPESVVSEPGTEILMESIDELENITQATERNQPAWALDIMGSRSRDSSSQKLLEDSLAAKELQTMEKHLSDIAKDLALWEEGRLSRNTTGQSSHVIPLDHQGNFKITVSQDSGPVQSGKAIQLQLQRNKSPPLSSNNSLLVSSVTNSRPQSSNTQTSRSSGLPTPLNRSATPNTLLQRPVSPNNQGNKEGTISMQRSQSLISKNQLGRTITSPAGHLETTGVTLGNITQRSSMSEDDFLQQLQLAHQPWILPADTESEEAEANRDKCE
ncbi:hypothetical protein Chor_002828 [Crotalus horridus]